MFSASQIHTLLEIVQRQTTLFIGQSLGIEFLSDQDKQVLRENGVNLEKVYDPNKDLVNQNFHLGLLSKILGDRVAQKLTFDQLSRYIGEGQYVPLNARERATVQNIKMQSLADIRSANNRIFSDINNVVSNQLGDARANQADFLRDQVAENTADRLSRREIARKISRLTGDWSRDFNKSVQYISHTALNEGRAALLHRRHGNNERAKVYFQVQVGACEHCVRLYLMGGIGNEPIVFTLQELEKNGSNIGRKTKDWRATVGPIHVNCRCLITEFREGSKWDEDKKMWIQPERESTSNRPKIKVTFNGEDFWV